MSDKAETPEVEAEKQELMPGQQFMSASETAAITTQSSVTMSPLQQLQQAKSLGLSIDEMKEMMTLQKEWEANEARKAFHAALAEFKKNPPKVVKDALNEKFGSSYVSIGNMVNTVNEAMGPWGLNARWDFPPDEDGKLVCTCILSHALGHEEKVTLKGPPDTEGSKNPLQQRKSARTYLKLETFEAVTGMASVIGNQDDDGNAANKSPEFERITEEQSMQIDAKITDNDLSREIFNKWVNKFFPYVRGSVDNLAASHFKRVMQKLDESIAAKKKADES